MKRPKSHKATDLVYLSETSTEVATVGEALDRGLLTVVLVDEIDRKRDMPNGKPLVRIRYFAQIVGAEPGTGIWLTQGLGKSRAGRAVVGKHNA